jgi:hypothetical protein
MIETISSFSVLWPYFPLIIAAYFLLKFLANRRNKMTIYRVRENVNLSNNSNEWIDIFSDMNYNHSVEYVKMLREKFPDREFALMKVEETEVKF